MVPPIEWAENITFINARKKIESLAVINDSAERCISLFQTNNSLANIEENKENALHVVEENRKKYGNLSKSNIVKKLTEKD